MTIIIDKEMCNHIEALQYEVESRKDIITMVLSGSVSIRGDLFEQYQEEYKSYFIEYNKAKQAMLEAYKVPKNSNWNLEFRSCELTYNG